MDFENEDFIQEGSALESIPPIMLKTDNLDNVIYEQKDFDKGVKDISYLCGQITALINTGLTPDVALDYLLNLQINKDNIENSIVLTKLNNEAQVKCAELSDIKAVMNTL